MRVCGAFLLVISVLGILHGARAGVAQAIYCRSRYMSPDATPERIAEDCNRAHALYPYNYYFCIWTGENAFHNRGKEGTTRAHNLLSVAEKWAHIGHELNPYNSEIKVLKTDVLSMSSIDAAVALWEPYLDWSFWEPFNHFVMVDLYIKAGRLDEAEEALYWLKDTRYFKDLAERLDAEFHKQLKRGK